MTICMGVPKTIVALCLAGLLFSCKDTPVSEKNREEPVSELSQINDAIREHPDNAENYAKRAELNRQSGNYGDAIIDMAEAMRRDSVNEDFHLLLADIYMESAKSQYALGTLERSAGLFPDSIRTFLKLAKFNLVVRQYDKASAALRQAMTIDPQNTEALHLLGIMYQEQGENEKAIQTYQTIVELDSEDAEAWTVLGNLLDEKGDKMAVQCFENAIRINPDYPQAWHSKAYYLQNHGKMDEAIEIYKHIHAIDSLYPDAWLNRGILYLALDSLENARDCFDHLTSIDSTSAMAYYYSGIAASKLNDTETAKKNLEKALSLAPGSPRIQDALNQLR